MIFIVFTIFVFLNLGCNQVYHASSVSITDKTQDEPAFPFLIEENLTKDPTRRQKFIPRITNGHYAKDKDFPYFVSFKKEYKTNQYVSFCGGTIIKRYVVLSAAHCFVQEIKNIFTTLTNKRHKLMNTMYVRAVAGNLKRHATFYPKYGPNYRGQWRRIGQIKYLPQFRHPLNDIAVIIMQTPFKLEDNTTVNSIAYDKQFKEYSELHCMAVGFGKYKLNKFYRHLIWAWISALTNRTCSAMHGKNMAAFVCTNDDYGDLLRGDNGGPLVCPKNATSKEYTLVGVASGNRPGVGCFFTRVSHFHKYIDKDKSYLLKPFQKLVGFCIVMVFVVFKVF